MSVRIRPAWAGWCWSPACVRPVRPPARPGPMDVAGNPQWGGRHRYTLTTPTVGRAAGVGDGRSAAPRQESSRPCPGVGRCGRRVPEATLLIIGDGPSRGDIETAVTAAGLQNSIQLLGRREDVPEILRTVDGVVSASVDEALPTALIEAGASGLPVVASDAGGTARSSSTGVTGRLVPLRGRARSHRGAGGGHRKPGSGQQNSGAPGGFRRGEVFDAHVGSPGWRSSIGRSSMSAPEKTPRR